MASAASKQTLSGPGDFARNHGVFGHFVNASNGWDSSPPMMDRWTFGGPRSTELLWQCLRLHAVSGTQELSFFWILLEKMLDWIRAGKERLQNFWPVHEFGILMNQCGCWFVFLAGLSFLLVSRKDQALPWDRGITSLVPLGCGWPGSLIAVVIRVYFFTLPGTSACHVIRKVGSIRNPWCSGTVQHAQVELFDAGLFVVNDWRGALCGHPGCREIEEIKGFGSRSIARIGIILSFAFLVYLCADKLTKCG